MASLLLPAHMSGQGLKLAHTAGRSALPNSRHRLSAVSWMQRIPAGLPRGMPGMGEEMEGAMQQAAQPGRQLIIFLDSDYLADARHGLDRMVVKRVGLADHADDGAVGAGGLVDIEVAVYQVCLDPVQLGVRGVFLHDDQHL